jgi:glycerol-3-phosphate acyltransferase PlsY
MDLLASILLGYLLGSIPFGLILTRAAGRGDLRQTGSGNIGATNVLRSGGRGLAAATLLLDAAKGAAAIFLSAALLPPDAWPGTVLIAGGAAVLGHDFPLWLRFRGGKGVATSFGVMLALSPVVGLVTCATWLAAAAIFRISSLAALAALLVAPLAAIWLAGGGAAALAAFLAVLGVVRHHSNIGRLLAGTEPRIGASKNDRS